VEPLIVKISIPLPFTQFFTIHAFLRNRDNVKKVSLCMAGLEGIIKSTGKYLKILRDFRTGLLGGRIVTDFERSILHGAKNALPPAR
jgi:hypothetical protein